MCLLQEACGLFLCAFSVSLWKGVYSSQDLFWSLGLKWPSWALSVPCFEFAVVTIICNWAVESKTTFLWCSVLCYFHFRFIFFCLPKQKAQRYEAVKWVVVFAIGVCTGLVRLMLFGEWGKFRRLSRSLLSLEVNGQDVMRRKHLLSWRGELSNWSCLLGIIARYS